MCGNPACRQEISDHGHSKRGGPRELDGDVCDKCNAEVVIPARLAEMGLALAELKAKRSKDLEKRSKDSEDGADETKDIIDLLEKKCLMSGKTGVYKRVTNGLEFVFLVERMSKDEVILLLLLFCCLPN